MTGVAVAAVVLDRVAHGRCRGGSRRDRQEIMLEEGGALMTGRHRKQMRRVWCGVSIIEVSDGSIGRHWLHWV